MSDFDRLEFRAGDLLRAEDLNTLVEAVVERLSVIEGGAGIAVMRDGRGNVHLTATGRQVFWGKADATINGASGDTPAAGNVTRWRYNGTANEAISGASYAVLNPAGAIASGQLVRVEEDMDGNLIAIPSVPTWLGKTTSTITARSGTTPGSGTVALQTLSGGSIVADPSGTTVTANQFSASATTIASGKYCTVAWFSGAWWVVSAEC